MIVLWLIAAHLIGDFVLQTRWQAAGKFDDPALRARHVWAYAVPFMPIMLWQTWGYDLISWGAQRGDVFIVLLVVLHYATDSRRFTSTLGDVVAWYWMTPSNFAFRKELEPLPPNPWPPIGIMIDQSLHMLQIAVLASLFLT